MTSNEREPLLKMEHVSVAFPVKKDFPFQKKRFVKAVTDVSLEIYPGETFGRRRRERLRQEHARELHIGNAARRCGQDLL